MFRFRIRSSSSNRPIIPESEKEDRSEFAEMIPFVKSTAYLGTMRSFYSKTVRAYIVACDLGRRKL